MRRHAILGRFGPRDKETVPPMPDEVVTTFDLVSSNRRFGFGIGPAIEDLWRIDVCPLEIGLDLLILAAHVWAADTRISRETESQDSWTRELRIIVPVSDPRRWVGAAPALKRMLDFLTGDRWALEFRPRPEGFASLLPRQSKATGKPLFNDVALFSGGLDSLIGAIDALEAGSVPLLISHASDGPTSDAQNTCFQYLTRHYSKLPLSRLRVWMSFPNGLVKGVKPESTTRGRSFLFFAIAVFAGTGLGTSFTLRAPENGFIALNVPLDPLRLGSQSTHTMHPFYLARWSEFLRMLGIPGRIENPYWHKTKGDMIADCQNPGLLRKLIPFSLSCSSPSKGRWLGHSVEHCGYCLPCLVRRAALEQALGRGSDPTHYTISDLSAQVLDTRLAQGQLVRSMQFAIQRLRANPELARFLIYKPGPLSDEPPENLPLLTAVYQHGIEEIATLLRDAQTRPG